MAATDTPVPPSGYVNIYRDEWGVPNIYAARESDGYFGFGYAVAEDSAERLYLNILAARGELAASVTPAELSAAARARFRDVDTLIENDYQARLWRIHEEATRSVSRLVRPLRENYAAFAAGVMSFAHEHPEKVPSWAPRRIEVADLVAAGQWILWPAYQAGVGLSDCRRGGVKPATFSVAKHSADFLDAAASSAPGATLPPTQGLSNEWAIMPGHTDTGGAILLSDPHGGIDSSFYEYRLHAGELQVSGFTDGVAMPVVMRNARVGWGMTTGSPDVADCYRVNTTSVQNTSYLFDGKARPIESFVVEIGVKGRAPERVTVKSTRHNGVYSPVVREVPGVVYVVSTPYMANLEGLHNSLYLMTKSSDVESFRAALSNGGMFPQNLLAADTQGDILYLRAGLTPRRPASSKFDSTEILDGNSSQTAWNGIHPTADLLSIKSPAAGYLENNNVSPRFMSDPPPQALSAMPAYLYDDGRFAQEPTSRSIAALRALGTKPRITRQDAFDIALSVKLVEEDRWVAMLRVAVAHFAVPIRPDEPRGRFITDLLSFDGNLLAASTSALKYIYFREALRPLLTAADMSNLSEGFDSAERLSPRMRGLFIGAIDTAFARMLAMPRGLDRTYGDEFRLRTGEGTSAPMSGGSLISLSAVARASDLTAGPGTTECSYRERLCATTLQAMVYSEPDERGQRFALGGSRIMRLDFYSPQGIESYSMQNPGQIPGGQLPSHESPHNYDQSRQLLSQRKLKKIYFEWNELREHVASKQTLRATGSSVK